MNDFFMKFSTPMLGLLGLVVGLFAGWKKNAADVEKQRINNLQEVVKLYKGTFDDLKEQLTNVSKEIMDLRKENSILKKEMNEIIQKNTLLKLEINKLSERLKKYQANG